MTNTRMPVYRGENLRAVAMPLGGIGTGTVALCGDGSLRQWQLNNTVNHMAHVPHSFFAVRVKPERGPTVSRVLQSAALYDEAFEPIPCANDYAIPDGCRELLKALPGVQSTEFEGEYPLARIRYQDEALPVQVSLEAYSPFCPLDADASGIPAVLYRFTVHNPGERPARVSFTAVQQNFVGWDGVREIKGVQCAQYGGNANTALRLRGLTGLTMQNGALPAQHPKNGSLCLAALHTAVHDEVTVTAFADIGDLSAFWNDTIERESAASTDAAGPSPDGRTLDCAVSSAVNVPPGESRTVTFVLAWHFPNRYVDYIQWFSGIDDPKSLFWIGNAYTNRFASAAAVAEYVRDNFKRLDAVTHSFRDAFFDSTLPPEILDVVSSQMSIIRTPTCFWDEKGKLFGFEGCNGASTGGWTGTGGCCPMNCTHVWAYEMSLAALFPALERTMRETELFDQLHATGYLPHRVTLPMYMPRPWERKIGGPETPALDGLLSMVLKSYREHRRCADRGWLESAWPKIETAMGHLFAVHDTDGDGVLKGEQPNTYDISIYGPNTFIGTLYLAALRAAEEMARILDKADLAARYRERFEKGSKGYDDLLWSGEYYIQIYDAEKNPEQNYGKGCHSDQLFGQWWAHVLGLGSVLPREHVQATVDSIVRHNLRENFAGHKQQPRQFASDDEPGLLICSWPNGERPKVPTLYSDEIWTGIEYEVAALCLYEDRPEDALKILRSARQRYNGARRSPWNDVECGDHYARALSSWALLDAAAGYQYDAVTQSLTIAPRLSPDDFRAFFITAAGWGTASLRRESARCTLTLSVAWGEVELSTLKLACPNAASVHAHLGDALVPCSLHSDGDLSEIQFADGVRLSEGDSILLVVGLV